MREFQAELVWLKPQDLTPYLNNTKDHPIEQLDKIAAQISSFGFDQPIVVDENKVIIKGHGRREASLRLGLAAVPCIIRKDLDDFEKRAARIGDNKVAESEWKKDLLRRELEALRAHDNFDDKTGFLKSEVDDLLKIAGAPGCDEDKTPEPPKIPKAKRGDIFKLGPHRVMCGDATNIQDLSLLLGGKKADLVFTDPPYNVASSVAADSIRPNSYGKLSKAEWDVGFDPQNLFKSIEHIISENASVYVCCSHFLAGKIWEWMSTWSDHYGACVWVKDNPMPSMHKRHWTWDHEYICYATRGKHTFNFPDSGHARATWEIAKSRSNTLHPTQKPVEVPERAVLHSSNSGQLVVDLFLGSGSTLIACEKAGRVCYGTEIDPQYVDVIVARWEEYSRKKAEVVSL